MPFPLEQAMSTAVSSVLPLPDGGQIVVGERVHASTRSAAMQNRTLDALQGAMRSAASPSERAFLESALQRFLASVRLRKIAADASALQAQEQASAAGDPIAAATIQGIQVMRLADMKDDARGIAKGLAAGNPEAIATNNQIAAAVANPGSPGYPTAIALQEMIRQVAIATGQSLAPPPQWPATAPPTPPAPVVPPAPADPHPAATTARPAAVAGGTPPPAAEPPAPNPTDPAIVAYADFEQRMARAEIEARAAAAGPTGPP